MKAVIITDTHFGYKFGTQNKKDDGERWLQMMCDYMDNFFLPLLRNTLKEGDIIVHMGDLYHDRGVIPIIVMNKVQYYIEEMCKLAPLHLLVGNHDLYKKHDNTVNSSKPFKWIDNLHLYEEPCKLNIGGKEVVMMPWVQEKQDMLKNLEMFAPADYLFCHSDLNGCMMHIGSYAHRNNDKINVESFKSYRFVYSGHIHILQKHKNFTFVGAPFEMDRNDLHSKKGIFVLDFDNGTETFFENNYSPKFRKIEIVEESDISKLEGLQDSKDYIDLYLSNKLLMSSKKIKRRIEEVTKTIRFENTFPINDLQKKVTDEEAEMRKELISEDVKLIMENNTNKDGSTKSQNDIMGDVVKYYIDNMSYEPDFKKELLAETNKVLSIHKNNVLNIMVDSMD